MNRHTYTDSGILLVLIFVLLTGCNTRPVEEDVAQEALPPTTGPSVAEVDNSGRFSGSDVIFQWGIDAEASTEFSDPEWTALQAIGEPDSPGCGDYQFSWASAASDSIDTLIVRFSEPVIPLEIVIHENFNPDQIVKVEVQDPVRKIYYTVLQKNPIRIDRPCPYELIIPVEGINFLTNVVRITIDQSQLGLGWNEIDAVQLTGTKGEE